MEIFIGLNIKYLCSKHSLSEEEFGAYFGQSQSVINTYSRGRSFPKVDTIQKICSHFNISIDDFINRDLNKVENSTVPKSIQMVEEPPIAGYLDDKTMVIEAQKETIASLREQISLLKDKVSLLETTKARAS